MVKIEFGKSSGGANSSITFSETKAVIAVSKPVIIQPSEIIAIRTKTIVKIPEDYYLSIVTSPGLIQKFGELLPSSIIINSEQDYPLEMGIRNNHKDPIQLMVNEVIGIGYLNKIQKIEAQELTISDEELEQLRRNTRPQRKNPNFHFDLE